MNFVPCLLLSALLGATALSGAPDAPILDRIQAAFNQGNLSAALDLADKAIVTNGVDPRLFFYRARIHEELGTHPKAIADFNQTLRLDPRVGLAYQHRGSEHFKLGHIRESISDFDRFLDLSPDQEPHHWQRGISYYYAGEFKKGRAQFELHQTVNPNDVENAVWHFLCVARQENVEKARAALLPITGDARVPMMQIHALFSGKGSVDKVLDAAKDDTARFYANLYLGLYFEALGDRVKTRDYIQRAAKQAPQKNYMGDVARIHAAQLEKSAPK